MPPLPQDTSSSSMVLWIIGILVAVIAALWKIFFDSHTRAIKDLDAAAEVVATLQAEVTRLSLALGEAKGELKHHQPAQ